MKPRTLFYFQLPMSRECLAGVRALAKRGGDYECRRVTHEAHKILCRDADESFVRKLKKVDGYVYWSEIPPLYRATFPDPNTEAALNTQRAVRVAAQYDEVLSDVENSLRPLWPGQLSANPQMAL